MADAPISGSTEGVEPGQIVSLTITDGTNTVTATATVDADGTYATTVDLSSLTDGELTVTATVTDPAGNEATATDTADLDTTAEITVSRPTSTATTWPTRRSAAAPRAWSRARSSA